MKLPLITLHLPLMLQILILRKQSRRLVENEITQHFKGVTLLNLLFLEKFRDFYDTVTDVLEFAILGRGELF